MKSSTAVVLGKGTRVRALNKLTNHTVILGFSNEFRLVSELAEANRNVRKAKLVLVSNYSTQLIQAGIVDFCGDIGKLKIHVIEADSKDSELHNTISLDKAKSVIVLAENKDEEIAKTITAIEGKAKHIVTSFQDASNAAKFPKVLNVNKESVISRVMAQGTRTPGLESVFLDLLDFAGDEIYFSSIPALAGKTYADAILAFNGASVIGLFEDGFTKVNPPMGTTLTSETKVIAIAEDDDQVIYTGVREDIAQSKVEPKHRAKPEPLDLLIVGWLPLGKAVLTELSAFAPANSRVHIVVERALVDQSELESLTFENLTITTSYVEVNGAEIDVIRDLSFKAVIILGYSQNLEHNDAQDRILDISAEIDQLVLKEPSRFGSVRVVYEDLGANDILGTLALAQLSENPQLEGVFTDLFDAQGATVNVRDVSEYAPLGVSVSFAELVAAARNFGESAIGYRVASSDSTLLNPSKIKEFVPATGDALIVVGDL